METRDHHVMMVGGRMTASFRRVQQINAVIEVTRSRELGSRVTAISRLGRLGEGVRLVLVLALAFECSEAAKAPPEVVKFVKPWMALAVAEKFMVKKGSRTVEVNNFTSVEVVVVSSPQQL
jgi:hypothetical protein